MDHPGQGYDPQCLVSTVDVDVLRRLPIVRTVQSIAHADKREEIKVLSAPIPLGGVLLFDRGYPGYDLIDSLLRRYQGSWVIRCPAAATLPAVEAFVQSGQTEATLTRIPPTAEPIALHAVRRASPDDEISVLLTNLHDRARFPAAAGIAL